MTHVRPLVRPFVRPLVRSGASGPYGGTVYQDGIHLNFASGNTTSGYYVKAVGAAPTVSPLTSLFTFTGGNQSMYMGPAGLLVASATNTPRIEYDANGNCLGLLMEASRTNLCLQSQTLDNASWVVFACSISANLATAPDGTTTADKIVEDGTTNFHVHTISPGGALASVASGAAYRYSFFAKASGRTRVSVQTDSTGGTGRADFDLSGLTTAVSGIASSPTISDYGNGWFRCSVTMTSSAIGVMIFKLILGSSSFANSYLGDGASGVLVWGCQVELGSFASSYIPTTTVSVARTADSCIRTLGSEFSATAGTVVVAGRSSSGRDAAEDQYVYQIDDVTFTERYRLVRFINTDTARFQVSDGGVSQAALDATFANSTAFKHAAAWTANDFAASFNGAAALTDAAGTLPTVTTLNLGVSPAGLSQMNGHILRFDYWPERRSNAFLQQTSA